MYGEIDVLTILYRLGLTFVFVGLIGYERQKRHKIAGITTHLLVAIGAASVAIAQQMMVNETILFIEANPALAGNVMIERQRIIAQIIAGVGFLGTGAILKRGEFIRGLTTASTLWMCAIIGLIFGLGFITLGIIASLLGLFTLYVIKRFTREPQEG